MNCWTFGAVKHSHLDETLVCDLTHNAAERINLAYYLSLGGSADTRVTRKVRERIKVQRKQHRLKSHHGTCMRSLAARVTRAYYGDIVISCFIYI